MPPNTQIHQFLRNTEQAKMQAYLEGMKKDPVNMDASRLFDFDDLQKPEHRKSLAQSFLLHDFETARHSETTLNQWLQQARMEACHTLFTANGRLRPEIQHQYQLSNDDIRILGLTKAEAKPSSNTLKEAPSEPPKVKTYTNDQINQFHMRLIDAYIVSFIMGPTLTDPEQGHGSQILEGAKVIQKKIAPDHIELLEKLSKGDFSRNIKNIRPEDIGNQRLSGAERQSISFALASRYIGNTLQTSQGNDFSELLAQTQQHTDSVIIEQWHFVCDKIETLEDTQQSFLSVFEAIRELHALIVDTFPENDFGADELTQKYDDITKAAGRSMQVSRSQLNLVYTASVDSMKRLATDSREYDHSSTLPPHIAALLQEGSAINQAMSNDPRINSENDIVNTAGMFESMFYSFMQIPGIIHCDGEAKPIDFVKYAINNTRHIEETFNGWQASLAYLKNRANTQLTQPITTNEQLKADYKKNNRVIRRWIDKAATHHYRRWSLVDWCRRQFSREPSHLIHQQIKRLPIVNFKQIHSLKARIDANEKLLYDIEPFDHQDNLKQCLTSQNRILNGFIHSNPGLLDERWLFEWQQRRMRFTYPLALHRLRSRVSRLKNFDVDSPSSLLTRINANKTLLVYMDDQLHVTDRYSIKHPFRQLHRTLNHQTQWLQKRHQSLISQAFRNTFVDDISIKPDHAYEINDNNSCDNTVTATLSSTSSLGSDSDFEYKQDDEEEKQQPFSKTSPQEASGVMESTVTTINDPQPNKKTLAGQTQIVRSLPNNTPIKSIQKSSASSEEKPQKTPKKYTKLVKLKVAAMIAVWGVVSLFPGVRHSAHPLIMHLLVYGGCAIPFTFRSAAFTLFQQHTVSRRTEANHPADDPEPDRHTAKNTGPDAGQLVLRRDTEEEHTPHDQVRRNI